MGGAAALATRATAVGGSVQALPGSPERGWEALVETGLQQLRIAVPYRREGRVSRVVGLSIESRGPVARVGELCRVVTWGSRGRSELLAEVVGFRDGVTVLMPLGEPEGVAPGSPVVACSQPLSVAVGRGLLGRVLDGLGRPTDGGPPVQAEALYPVAGRSPSPMGRQRIRRPLSVGVRAIDGLLSCGRGQRLGIFAGSGVGKSTLLGMMARGTEADVTVVALVGERGREVREFLERDLDPAARKRAVVVAATSDQPAMVRLKAAFVATAIAEFFRDQGADVLLLMDSVTRFAAAQREVGLAAGEPPATRGYPPSVFALLPKLLERAGTAERGSITGFYTVLVDGDDLSEPIADAVRGILDGHVVLSRALAEKGRYPAIDVLASVSRLMPSVAEKEHREAAARVRQLLAAYRDAEDLVLTGAYAAGSDPVVDEALRLRPEIERYLSQEVTDRTPWAEAVRRLTQLTGQPVAEG